jgi:thiamine-monophosphate kinase
MSLSEFDIINRYFRGDASQHQNTLLGIGDDAAIIQPPPGKQLHTCIVQWVAGQHYHTAQPGDDTGRRLLETAMQQYVASAPADSALWMTLSITLESAVPEWIQSFAEGLLGSASKHGIELIGGDTSHGAGCLRLQLIGAV